MTEAFKLTGTSITPQKGQYRYGIFRLLMEIKVINKGKTIMSTTIEFPSPNGDYIAIYCNR